MAKTETKATVPVFMLPEMRVINAALFERDAYTSERGGAPGAPKYKIELAGDVADLTGEGTIEDRLADAIAAEFGDKIADKWLAEWHLRRDMVCPFLDGNEMAAAREAKGKPGDAYKGKLVIRSDTTFNFEGKVAAGGIKVYGPDAELIGPANQSAIYNGCYGIAAVTISTYPDYPRKGDFGAKFYLVAFQKTRDGEVLKGADNTAALFKPVAGAASGAGAEGGRRRRAG